LLIFAEQRSARKGNGFTHEIENEPPDSISNGRAEKLECRMMRELHFLIKAANQETDLRERLARLQHVGDLLESLSRIMPELD
jgi:hypothetical protein